MTPIALGTICVIRNVAEVIEPVRGRFCTLVGYSDDPVSLLFGMDCRIEIASFPCPAGPGTWWLFKSKNLIPLNGGADDVLLEDIALEQGAPA